MVPRLPPVSSELARVGPLMSDAVVLVGMVAAVAVVLVGTGCLAATLCPRWARVRFRWWVHQRAVRCFVASITAGDMGVADAAARRVLGHHGAVGEARLRRHR